MKLDASLTHFIDEEIEGQGSPVLWLKSHGGWALFEPKKSTPGPVLLTALLHWLSCYCFFPSSPSLSSFHQPFLPFFFLFRFVEGLLISSYDMLCYNEHRINDTIIKIKTFSSTPSLWRTLMCSPSLWFLPFGECHMNEIEDWVDFWGAFFHWSEGTWDSPSLLHILVPCFCLWWRSSSWCDRMVVCSSLSQLMDIWIISSLGRLWRKLLQIFASWYLCGHLFSFSWVKSPKVGLLGHMINEKLMKI